MVVHPTKYTDVFIPIFADKLRGCKCVLDPFAGTGKLAAIKDYGYAGRVVCCEIEPEWANCGLYKVDEWHIGDSSKMLWAKNNSFDAICTSPTYGNRMADNYKPNDNEDRKKTYRHALGHPLSENNSGKMQWGKKYRELHIEVYNECSRVLKPRGLMIVNMSNHIRRGKEIDVCSWHQCVLEKIGFKITDIIKVSTPRYRYGQNYKARVTHEQIMLFESVR